MQCPFCFAANTKVIDSRLVTEGNAVRRRRECQVCQERFTSFETAELLMPRVVKSNGVRDPFNEEKLRHGIVRALEKRPVSVDQIEASLGRIMHQLRAKGEREVSSYEIGELVIETFRTLANSLLRSKNSRLIVILDGFGSPFFRSCCRVG